jgi:hypothetical protein
VDAGFRMTMLSWFGDVKAAEGGRPPFLAHAPHPAHMRMLAHVAALYTRCTLYDAIASSAMRLRITSVEPSSRINCFLFNSVMTRVTVSRDDPIICAISS